MSGGTVHELFGRDAPITINEQGGMQSKAAGAFYQLPSRAIERLRKTYVESATRGRHLDYAWEHITALLADDHNLDHLGLAMVHLAWANDLNGQEGVFVGNDTYGVFAASALLRIAQVMEEGANRYARGNWRKIPYESQINHAVQHMVALTMGDTSDDHIGHAITRLAFAIEVEDQMYRFTAIEEPKPKVVALAHPREIVDIARNGTSEPPTYTAITFENGDVESLAKTLETLPGHSWATLCEAMSFAFAAREPADGNLGFAAGATIFEDC